ncbi:ABC transporter permease [Brochothrix thermosphacta]|uniref:ABC transporter permease n=1 Tax=Brochothrix thermosphacta TaxID=2756 RepID=UPI0003E85197|nr:ABC transporter permease [Brochothrix thermosphacta]EUJ37270.1 permease family protein [Brochothrix thermosphacta DSM 20171 = FSL F6-1036]ODJ49161.1 ABC transporter permease [Brochothrix thermosphacta DSM 20171 = FSL F6-1036]
MNFIKRAWYSIIVKRGRTFLLIAVFSAILIFILAGLTIKSAALQASENAKENIGATATLSINRENMREQRGNQDKSTTEKNESATERVVKLTDVEKIAQLDNVSSYNILSSTSAGATSKFTAIESSSDSSSTTDTKEADGHNDSGGPQQAQGDFAISGVLSTAALEAFSDDGNTIISGKAITEADKNTNNVMIESTLAEQNDLKVGDTFKITNATDTSVTYKMIVKGIYETSEVADGMGMNFAFMDPVNTIYTSYTFANTMKGSTYKNTADSATYTLAQPKQLTAFVKQANKLIDTDTFELQTNDSLYQQMLKPISNITSFSENIVLLVSVAGTIILALIVMLTIRERKYEIGVLLALGENRFKMIAQFFTELILVLSLSLVIAGFSGSYVGNIVGEQLLAQETESTTTSNTSKFEGGEPNGGGGPGQGGEMAEKAKQPDEIKSLDITLSLTELLELGGLGLGICFLSVLIASVGIIRLQPKNILTS